MRAIFEGSSKDIRDLLADPNAAIDNTKLSLVQSDLDALKEKNLKLTKDFADQIKRTSDAMLEKEVFKDKAAKLDRALKEKDNLIFSLQSSASDKLTPIQEAEIETLYQEMLVAYGIKPVSISVTNGEPITAEHMFRTVFTRLCSGDRIGAIKEIRVLSNMSLTTVKSMVDGALKRFGCQTNSIGLPMADD